MDSAYLDDSLRYLQGLNQNDTHTQSDVWLTLGEGRMENVDSILSGYSCSIHIRGQTRWVAVHTTSRNFDRSREPRPAPVPPPREWIIWNPCIASQASAWERTCSWAYSQSGFGSQIVIPTRMLSTSSAPRQVIIMTEVICLGTNLQCKLD